MPRLSPGLFTRLFIRLKKSGKMPRLYPRLLSRRFTRLFNRMKSLANAPDFLPDFLSDFLPRPSLLRNTNRSPAASGQHRRRLHHGLVLCMPVHSNSRFEEVHLSRRATRVHARLYPPITSILPLMPSLSSSLPPA